MSDSLALFAAAIVRCLPALALTWLAVFFGRTLRAGAVPLIERIARIGKPGLSKPLVRYARLLTALWCGYFVVAASLTLLTGFGFAQASVGVAAFSIFLFVGEHALRRFLFPGEAFPGLFQQIRDTVEVWRPGARRAGAPSIDVTR